MINIQVQTVTGQTLNFDVNPAETVASLKYRIWDRERLPPYHQGLIYAGQELQRDELKLNEYGVVNGSVLKLLILARSGPLSFASPVSGHFATDLHLQGPSTSAAASTSISNVPLESMVASASSHHNDFQPQISGESYEECALDLTFTDDRKADAKRRAEENLRTFAKMRELRQNMERLRVERKSKTVDLPADSSRPRRSSAGGTGVVPRIGAPRQGLLDSRGPIPASLLSAPEDTSAKESSAGETESEDWRPTLPLSIRDYIGQERFSNSLTNAGRSLQQKSNYYSWRIAPSPPTQRRHFATRVPSSSSEPDSSIGGIYTASELEEEGDASASEAIGEGENVENDQGDDDDDQFYEYRTESSEFETGEEGQPTALTQTTALSHKVESPSDPSELSSGMIVCDLTSDFRKKRVRPKHQSVRPADAAAPGTSVGRGAPPTGRPRRGAAAAPRRPRSKPRQVLSAVNPTTIGTTGKTKGESSSDENDGGWSSEGAKKSQVPAASCTVSTRKTLATPRFSKYRTAGGGPGVSADVAVVRNHKLPQSSQSQLRCHACGQRLQVAQTYQCRCGKALCTRHRSQEAHTCSYDSARQMMELKSSKNRVPQASD